MRSGGGQYSQSGCTIKVANGCLLRVSLIAWPLAGEGAGFTLGYLKNKNFKIEEVTTRRHTSATQEVLRVV